MAKKKKKTTRRRRRIGAAMTASNPIVKYGPIALGFLLGNKINEQIDKVAGDKIDSKILAAAQGGIGALLVFKGKPSMVKSIAGGILLGSGVKRAMSAFGMGNIGGYGAVPVIGGYGAVPVIGSRTPRRVGVGSYRPAAGQIGAYDVPRQVKVMSGVGCASGYNNGSGTSGYMQ
jgi:hypothetical protein